VQSLAEELVRRDVHIVRSRVSDLAGTGVVRAVRLQNGTELSGDLFVFACGAWLPAVFPEVLRGRIRPTRQVVIYFGTPAGDDRFGPHRMPAWIDLSAGTYGVPDLEGRGLKVGIDTHGPQFDPDDDDRTLDEESVRQTRSWLARRLPAMAYAPIVESRICQYENTPAGDFLIDRHPDYENVWIAGGGSGHGFKHGPAVGEYVAALITRRAEPEARFTLRSQKLDAARAIY
jgi:glycine/D-amino acid oxidase-like deaminating enzyme